jgi:glycosyltransferase involved in cell wall biosynthesis
MLIGIPIIATMAGGTSSILKDCKEGTLIQDGDPYSLAGAIMTCIANYDKAIAMGKQARETSHKRHDPIIITNDLINIYKSVKQNG